MKNNLELNNSSPTRVKKILPVTKEVEEVYKIFKKNGFQCFVIGGFVRDHLLKRDDADIDFATDATPDQVIALFPKTILTGVEHGTVTVVFHRRPFEVTTFRCDSSYGDARRPDSVSFSSTLKEDVVRRDFTVNALAYDIESKEIIDYVGGLGDLEKKILRTIGSAEKRFGEDALRLMRACRFVSQLQFAIEKKTKEAMQLHANRIKSISAERIQVELTKLLVGQKPSAGLEAMRESGLLLLVLPEVAATLGVKQNAHHSFDVYHHTLHVVDRCEVEWNAGETRRAQLGAGQAKLEEGKVQSKEEKAQLALAALFHDVGKVDTRVLSEATGDYSFHGHEHVGAKKAQQRMRALRYSKRTTTAVVHLVNHHMVAYRSSWTDAAVRRFIRRIGSSMLDLLFALVRADRFGKHARENIEDQNNLQELINRIDEELKKQNALSVKDLKIDGGEIMREFNMPAGKKIGEVLKHLLDVVLENPEKNEKAKLIEEARKFF